MARKSHGVGDLFGTKSHVIPYPNLFAVLGLGVAAYVGLRLLITLERLVVTWIVGRKLKLGVDFRQMGPWAVVTGATDGIGRGYARGLARRGLNIVLVSRSQEKLARVAGEIESEFHVKTKTVAIDFTDENSAGIHDRVLDATRDLHVGTLVNNVGMVQPYPEYFNDIENGDQLCMDTVRVNCLSQVMVTRAILPQMVSRRRGVVINLSSASALTPTPLLAIYSASKIFNHFFSRSLEQEYRSKGIIFQSVMPFGVATQMTKVKQASSFFPSADDYADSALSTVGLQAVTHGYPTHALQGTLYRIAPQWLVEKLQWRFVNDMRKRAMRRKERQQGGEERDDSMSPSAEAASAVGVPEAARAKAE